MFLKTSLLIALAFTSIYPLCFWSFVHRPLKKEIRKFHLGLPNVTGGIILVSVWLFDIPLSLKVIVTIWKGALFSVSRFSWKKECPNDKLMIIPALIGIYALIRIQTCFDGPEWPVIFAGALISMIACFLLFIYQLRHNQ